MIHYVLLTRDDLGRSVVDSRVIDVDSTDGLDSAGRVNAGVDVMLTAARETGTRVGPIGVAARTGSQRRQLRSRGSGPRRQVRLTGEDEAVLAYLADTGEIDRFSSAVVVDCGDTGMSLYTLDPREGRIGNPEHSTVLSGRRLDRSIVDRLITDNPALSDSTRTRADRSELRSACRTAKEEIAYGGATSAESVVTVSANAGRVTLSAAHVEQAIEPMIRDAREVFARYVAAAQSRGVRPDAVVFIGGLANLPAVHAIAKEHGLEMVTPAAPELVVATGAALLALQSYSGAARLAFIGGKPHREWLSATPIAVAGAVIAATLMTIYAVSSSFADRPAVDPQPAVSSVPPAVATSDEEPPVTPRPTSQPITRIPAGPVEPTVVPPVPTQRPMPETGWNDPPAWATTELQPTRPSTSTSTRTLSPFPWPDLPFPPGSTPTIPPDLLPPGLRPPSVAPTPPPPTYSTTTPESARGGSARPSSTRAQGTTQVPAVPESGKPVDRAGESVPPASSPQPSSPVPSVPAPR
ncbi:Hsp70 family protein [Gordonia sp. NPDC058843]|uniref:Hsp70 family protein n=1 Tax=Gordonia sp. NPDC058843 TaxID=3346648 RepID=UPI0036739601